MIRRGGEVMLSRIEAEVDDSVLGQFLGLLAREIASHPERLHVIDSS